MRQSINEKQALLSPGQNRAAASHFQKRMLLLREMSCDAKQKFSFGAKSPEYMSAMIDLEIERTRSYLQFSPWLSQIAPSLKEQATPIRRKLAKGALLLAAGLALSFPIPVFGVPASLAGAYVLIREARKLNRNKISLYEWGNVKKEFAQKQEFWAALEAKKPVQ